MVCSRAVAYALASYRLCLAQALARSGNPTSPLADVVLASFKGIVQDSAVRAEFEQAWSVKCQEMAGPEVSHGLVTNMLLCCHVRVCTCHTGIEYVHQLDCQD